MRTQNVTNKLVTITGIDIIISVLRLVSKHFFVVFSYHLFCFVLFWFVLFYFDFFCCVALLLHYFARLTLFYRYLHIVYLPFTIYRTKSNLLPTIERIFYRSILPKINFLIKLRSEFFNLTNKDIFYFFVNCTIYM